MRRSASTRRAGCGSKSLPPWWIGFGTASGTSPPRSRSAHRGDRVGGPGGRRDERCATTSATTPARGPLVSRCVLDHQPRRRPPTSTMLRAGRGAGCGSQRRSPRRLRPGPLRESDRCSPISIAGRYCRAAGQSRRDGRVRAAISTLLDLAERAPLRRRSWWRILISPTPALPAAKHWAAAARGKRLRRIVAGIPTRRFRDRLTAMAARRGDRGDRGRCRPTPARWGAPALA